MMTKIFIYLNIFIVLFVAGTLMFSSFKPETFKKLIYLASAIIILPVLSVAAMNLAGNQIYWVSDLIFMRGGNIGVPVTFGYGIALGLLLNKLWRLIGGGGKSEKGPEEEQGE